MSGSGKRDPAQNLAKLASLATLTSDKRPNKRKGAILPTHLVPEHVPATSLPPAPSEQSHDDSHHRNAFHARFSLGEIASKIQKANPIANVGRAVAAHLPQVPVQQSPPPPNINPVTLRPTLPDVEFLPPTPHIISVGDGTQSSRCCCIMTSESDLVQDLQSKKYLLEMRFESAVGWVEVEDWKPITFCDESSPHHGSNVVFVDNIPFSSVQFHLVPLCAVRAGFADESYVRKEGATPSKPTAAVRVEMRLCRCENVEVVPNASDALVPTLRVFLQIDNHASGVQWRYRILAPCEGYADKQFRVDGDWVIGDQILSPSMPLSIPSVAHNYGCQLRWSFRSFADDLWSRWSEETETYDYVLPPPKATSAIRVVSLGALEQIFAWDRFALHDNVAQCEYRLTMQQGESRLSLTTTDTFLIVTRMQDGPTRVTLDCRYLFDTVWQYGSSTEVIIPEGEYPVPAPKVLATDAPADTPWVSLEDIPPRYEMQWRAGGGEWQLPSVISPPLYCLSSTSTICSAMIRFRSRSQGSIPKQAWFSSSIPIVASLPAPKARWRLLPGDRALLRMSFDIEDKTARGEVIRAQLGVRASDDNGTSSIVPVADSVLRTLWIQGSDATAQFPSLEDPEQVQDAEFRRNEGLEFIIPVRRPVDGDADSVANAVEKFWGQDLFMRIGTLHRWSPFGNVECNWDTPLVQPPLLPDIAVIAHQTSLGITFSPFLASVYAARVEYCIHVTLCSEENEEDRHFDDAANAPTVVVTFTQPLPNVPTNLDKKATLEECVPQYPPIERSVGGLRPATVYRVHVGARYSGEDPITWALTTTTTTLPHSIPPKIAIDENGDVSTNVDMEAYSLEFRGVEDLANHQGALGWQPKADHLSYDNWDVVEVRLVSKDLVAHWPGSWISAPSSPFAPVVSPVVDVLLALHMSPVGMKLSVEYTLFDGFAPIGSVRRGCGHQLVDRAEIEFSDGQQVTTLPGDTCEIVPKSDSKYTARVRVKAGNVWSPWSEWSNSVHATVGVPLIKLRDDTTTHYKMKEWIIPPAGQTVSAVMLPPLGPPPQTVEDVNGSDLLPILKKRETIAHINHVRPNISGDARFSVDGSCVQWPTYTPSYPCLEVEYRIVLRTLGAKPVYVMTAPRWYSCKAPSTVRQRTTYHTHAMSSTTTFRTKTTLFNREVLKETDNINSLDLQDWCRPGACYHVSVQARHRVTWASTWTEQQFCGSILIPRVDLDAPVLVPSAVLLMRIDNPDIDLEKDYIVEIMCPKARTAWIPARTDIFSAYSEEGRLYEIHVPDTFLNVELRLAATTYGREHLDYSQWFSAPTPPTAVAHLGVSVPSRPSDRSILGNLLPDVSVIHTENERVLVLQLTFVDLPQWRVDKYHARYRVIPEDEAECSWKCKWIELDKRENHVMSIMGVEEGCMELSVRIRAAGGGNRWCAWTEPFLYEVCVAPPHVPSNLQEEVSLDCVSEGCVYISWPRATTTMQLTSMEYCVFATSFVGEERSERQVVAFIEDAGTPGDTLAVILRDLRPNILYEFDICARYAWIGTRNWTSLFVQRLVCTPPMPQDIPIPQQVPIPPGALRHNFQRHVFLTFPRGPPWRLQVRKIDSDTETVAVPDGNDASKAEKFDSDVDPVTVRETANRTMGEWRAVPMLQGAHVDEKWVVPVPQHPHIVRYRLYDPFSGFVGESSEDIVPWKLSVGQVKSHVAFACDGQMLVVQVTFQPSESATHYQVRTRIQGKWKESPVRQLSHHIPQIHNSTVIDPDKPKPVVVELTTLDGLVHGRQYTFAARVLHQHAVTLWSRETEPVLFSAELPCCPPSIMPQIVDTSVSVRWSPQGATKGIPMEYFVLMHDCVDEREELGSFDKILETARAVRYVPTTRGVTGVSFCIEDAYAIMTALQGRPYEEKDRPERQVQQQRTPRTNLSLRSRRKGEYMFFEVWARSLACPAEGINIVGYTEPFKVPPPIVEAKEIVEEQTSKLLRSTKAKKLLPAFRLTKDMQLPNIFIENM